MLKKPQFNKSASKFLAVLAQHPFLTFLLLLLAVLGFAAVMALDFQKNYLAANVPPGLTSPQAIIFDAAEIKKYQKVFSILEQREKEYNQTGETSYPEVFGFPAPQTPAAPEGEAPLTLPAN